ncbi:MAG: RagB/SusD family nutrient uptake outer membrane protein [Gemmatimonadaceae bacterium]|nr:RagB/SusD family nutrient uptake outer membrane protein [Gemmatimonadaceae bacterium]
MLHHFRGTLRRTATIAATLSSVVVMGGCNLFDTDINNPNAVIDTALDDAAGATTLVNGLGGSLTRTFTSVYGPYTAASDELTWSGSREFWKLLDDGDIADPVNEYTDGAYPQMSQTRWLANFTLEKMEGFDKANTLRNRKDLARAYIYAAITYITIGEMFDDFVIGSNRTEATANVGPANMGIMFDSAIVYLNKGLVVAQATSDQELQRQVLGLRARAKFSKAAWAKLRPARTAPADPYVNDAGATADAQAALALMATTYRYRLTPTANNLAGINVGFEMNNRGELRVGTEYGNADPARPIVLLAGLAGVKLNDPISGAPDPVLARAIDECCRPAVGNNVPFTVTSWREMQLIAAEASLASGNTADFTTRINAVRALDNLPAWAGTPSAQAILIHERRVNLFFQGRRLTDLYRFGQKDPRWLSTASTSKKACFLPISYIERQANPATGLTSTSRADYCQ